MDNSIFALTTVDLSFKGYYQEKQVQNIPLVDGICAAFACTLQVDDNGRETREPQRVIYIGKATGTDNLKVRVAQHVNNDHPTWKKHLNPGEHILYSCAEYSDNKISDVEAALIYENKPSENTNSKNSYTGQTSPLRVVCSGDYQTLIEKFIVH